MVTTLRFHFILKLEFMLIKGFKRKKKCLTIFLLLLLPPPSLQLSHFCLASSPMAKFTIDITKRDISRFSGVIAVNFDINVLEI